MIRRPASVWTRWLGMLAALSTLFAVIPDLNELRVAHGVLAYLLLIIGASREANRRLTMVMVVGSYLAVDWFFVPPRRSLGVPSELDLIILLGFLVTSIVISQLVFSLQRVAIVATSRAEEIERLSADRLHLERQAARAEMLHEAERLKNALIASMTHDLRSPLSTLAMLSDTTTGIARPDALARVARETQRMNDYLIAMRKYAFDETRPSSDQHMEVHVVDDVISTARQSRERELAGRDVQVNIPEQPAIILVLCDFTLTLQILANLLENASRYSPPGSTIDIAVAWNDDQVEITVGDRGPGISPGEAHSVFEPLRRGDSGTKAGAAEGMGMGLSIARTFARAQRGDLWYRRRDGGGALFGLVLPAAELPSTLTSARFH